MPRPSNTEPTPWRDEQTLRRLYHGEGLSIREVADRLGCNYDTARKWLKRHGIDRRSEGGRHGENHHSWAGGHGESAYYGASWWRNRPKVLERDGHKCVLCRTTQSDHRDEFGRGLEVHHIVGFGEFDSHEAANEVTNLITLCKPCHVEVEQNDELNSRLKRWT